MELLVTKKLNVDLNRNFEYEEFLVDFYYIKTSDENVWQLKLPESNWAAVAIFDKPQDNIQEIANLFCKHNVREINLKVHEQQSNDIYKEHAESYKVQKSYYEIFDINTNLDSLIENLDSFICKRFKSFEKLIFFDFTEIGVLDLIKKNLLKHESIE